MNRWAIPGRPGRITGGASRSLYIWLCVACLVAGLVVAGWRRAHWPRRIAGAAAVVLALVSAGSAVNQTFSYYPTFDRLFGKSVKHFLNDAQLNALRTQVARTGQLPDHGATLSVPIPAATGSGYTPRPAYVGVPPAWSARNHPQLPVIATPPGAHSFVFWQQAFSDSLPWLSWKLKLTPQPHSVPP